VVATGDVKLVEVDLEPPRIAGLRTVDIDDGQASIAIAGRVFRATAPAAAFCKNFLRSIHHLARRKNASREFIPESKNVYKIEFITLWTAVDF